MEMSFGRSLFGPLVGPISGRSGNELTHFQNELTHFENEPEMTGNRETSDGNEFRAIAFWIPRGPAHFRTFQE